MVLFNISGKKKPKPWTRFRTNFNTKINTKTSSTDSATCRRNICTEVNLPQWRRLERCLWKQMMLSIKISYILETMWQTFQIIFHLR